MSFLAPTAFAFAATLPVVVVFYLLKRKRVVRLVPSTLLWQKFLAESQASAPFQKLRHNWLLILQLLLLALVVFGLARPYFASTTPGGRLLVVILDGSASMQSTDVKPSRFDVARQEALRLVNSLHGADQMVVVLAGAHTEVKQSPTSDKSALRRAIESCHVSDASTRLIDALKLAQPLVKDRPNAEVHLFSDGAAGDLHQFAYQRLPVVYHEIGTRGRNLGIVTLDVRSDPEDAHRRVVFTSIENAGTNTADTDLELLFDGQLVATRPLAVGPKATVSEVFTADQTTNGIFAVHLTADDDLAVDNQAWIVSELPQPIKVLLVTHGNRFLEKALAAAPHTQVTVAHDLTDKPSGFDVTVLDDVTPTTWPAGNVLAVRSAPTNWLTITGQIKTPTIVDWKNTHPLLRFVNLDNVQIAQALTIKTPSWAAPIVESRGTPLVLAGERGDQRIVWLGFNTLESTWPLRVSFPIFIANAIDWLNPFTAQVAQFLARPGAALSVPLQTEVSTAHVRLPDGSSHTLHVEPGANELVFGDTAHVGVYHLSAGTNQFTYCVDLLDPAESDTTPQPALHFGPYTQTATTPVRRANAEIWRWFALAGLAILMFEWWYYHRRTA